MRNAYDFSHPSPLVISMLNRQVSSAVALKYASPTRSLSEKALEVITREYYIIEKNIGYALIGTGDPIIESTAWK